VGESPVDGVDPEGLWEASATADLGVGFEINFGYNDGQWNLGGYLGVGEGLSGSFNPNDSECHNQGSVDGMIASGQIGLGPGVEADAGYAFGSPSDSSAEISVEIPQANASASVGEEGGNATVGGSALLGKTGSVSANGEVTVGESAFFGVGGTIYGAKR
jgi:hypothetical protein